MIHVYMYTDFPRLRTTMDQVAAFRDYFHSLSLFAFTAKQIRASSTVILCRELILDNSSHDIDP